MFDITAFFSIFVIAIAVVLIMYMVTDIINKCNARHHQQRMAELRYQNDDPYAEEEEDEDVDPEIAKQAREAEEEATKNPVELIAGEKLERGDVVTIDAHGIARKVPIDPQTEKS